jgi:hypothetical protein
LLFEIPIAKHYTERADRLLWFLLNLAQLSLLCWNCRFAQANTTGCYAKSFRKIYNHIYITATLRLSTDCNRHRSDAVTTFSNRWTNRTKISDTSHQYRIRSHVDSDVCVFNWCHHKIRGLVCNTLKPSGHYMYHQV